MKILSIEASAVAASAAVSEDGRLIAEEFTQNALTHSVTLLPAVSSVLKKAGLTLNDMDLIAVTNGPGSFSGLRIGVTTAKTLAYAANKKVIGVCTLKALAARLPMVDGLICPIMDARRDQVYNAVYKWENGLLAEVRAPRALSANELCEDISKNLGRVIFIGDGVPRFREYFEQELGENALFAPLMLCASSASALALAASLSPDEAVHPEELNPVYLRLSQAEREYLEKHGKE